MFLWGRDCVHGVLTELGAVQERGLEEDWQSPRAKRKRWRKSVCDANIGDSDGLPVLAALCPETGAHHLKREPKWHDVELVVGSGAAESVAPQGMAPWIEPRESTGSKWGQTYLSASGVKLPNSGEAVRLGKEVGLQVVEITRPPCSLNPLCDMNNRVVVSSVAVDRELCGWAANVLHLAEQFRHVVNMCVEEQGGEGVHECFGRQGSSECWKDQQL